MMILSEVISSLHPVDHHNLQSIYPSDPALAEDPREGANFTVRTLKIPSMCIWTTSLYPTQPLTRLW